MTLVVKMDVARNLPIFNLLMMRKKSRKLKRLAMKTRKKIFVNIIKRNYLVSCLLMETRNRNIWAIQKHGKYWEEDVPKFDAIMFKENFGMTRESFQILVSKLRNLKREDTNMRRAIPLEKRIAASLYALRSSAEYKTISFLFGVGRTTLGQMVLEFCKEIYSHLKDEFFTAYPPTQQKIEEIVSGFGALGFPQCYGAIDGCHIPVCPPAEDATDYFNFKGWYSIILFAAVDHKYRFTYINVGATGRNNDSSIFESSLLKEMHENFALFKSNSKNIEGVSVPIVLIGDSAFQLSEVVMKPFPFYLNQPPSEKRFNYMLSRCRRVVENSFGQLKSRFRKLGKGLEVRIYNAHKIVQAACVLHNFCIQQKDYPDPSWVAGSSTNLQQPQHTTRRNTNQRGTDIRNALKDYLYREDLLGREASDVEDGEGSYVADGEDSDVAGGAGTDEGVGVTCEDVCGGSIDAESCDDSS